MGRADQKYGELSCAQHGLWQGGSWRRAWCSPPGVWQRRTQPGNAWATIGQLEAAGYDVNVDRVGSAPYDQCIVTSVRNPQDITRTIRVDNGRDKDGKRDFDLVEIVVRRTITVSLNCDV